MPSSTPGAYFIIEDARDAVDIDDTVDDKEITNLGDEVNREFETDIFPYSDQLPLTGELLNDGKAAVILLFRSRWKAKRKAFDEAKYWEEQYRKKLKNVIFLLQSTPTTRTIRKSVVTEYRNEILFSQQKRF